MRLDEPRGRRPYGDCTETRHPRLSRQGGLVPLVPIVVVIVLLLNSGGENSASHGIAGILRAPMSGA
jgi:hypothetical protein